LQEHTSASWWVERKALKESDLMPGFKEALESKMEEFRASAKPKSDAKKSRRKLHACLSGKEALDFFDEEEKRKQNEEEGKMARKLERELKKKTKEIEELERKRRVEIKKAERERTKQRKEIEASKKKDEKARQAEKRKSENQMKKDLKDIIRKELLPKKKDETSTSENSDVEEKKRKVDPRRCMKCFEGFPPQAESTTDESQKIHSTIECLVKLI
jgi:hypothetical protein